MTEMVFSVLALLAAEFQVGQGATVITPPAGTPMAGYYALRLATGTHDDLRAKAIVMDDGKTQVAMVACDLVSLPPEVIAEARALAEKKTGIPASQIMVSATHTHTGPLLRAGDSTRAKEFGAELPVLDGYMKELPERIAEAVRLAQENRKPASVQHGAGNEATVAFNRRFHMRDGSVGWNPGKKNPAIVRAAGPVDPTLHVVRFEKSDGSQATYLNYALHADTVGGTEWGGDYPATLSKISSGEREGLTLFTLGAAGNINHLDVSDARPQKGHAEAERIGQALGREALKTLATGMKVVPDPVLRSARREVSLAAIPVGSGEATKAREIVAQLRQGKTPKFLDTVSAFRVLDVEARGGAGWDVEVMAVALSPDLAWVALPGEVFVELGQRIQWASPFRHTIVVTLAKGLVTYYPNAEAFPQGNYEVVTARTVRGSGEKLVETALELLREIRKDYEK